MTDITTKRKRSRAARQFRLTPKIWKSRCSYCGKAGSCVAYRHKPRAYACPGCVKERGIVARPSQSWLEGGSQTDATVTITFVDPATLVQ